MQNYKKLIGSISIITFSYAASRALGFFREILLANWAGVSEATDTLDLAFIIPDFLFYLSAGGYLAITLIPIMSKKDKEESPLDKKLHELRQNKIERNYLIIDNLEKLGIYIDKKDLDSLETKVPGRPHIAELKAKGYDVDENVGRVSIIGAGMKSESGVASKMFKILGENSINISMISTSPIRVSCVIDSKDINAAFEALHKEFIEKE